MTGFPALDYDEYNQLRYDSFNQLDLRIDKEWYLPGITINIYADIQNILNTQAVSSTLLVQELDNEENPIIVNPGDPIEQQRYLMKEVEASAGTILPTIGIIIEF